MPAYSAPWGTAQATIKRMLMPGRKAAIVAVRNQLDLPLLVSPSHAPVRISCAHKPLRRRT